MPYTVAIAGSTTHTLLCAEMIAEDTRFKIAWVLTPSPKHQGRSQVIVENPLHSWTTQHKIKTILVSQKIDKEIKSQLPSVLPDFLLVVDFGYYIPDWLIKLPKIAPLNIHPSQLPRWRGSSPGQFVIINGENKSGVSLIMLAKEMDAGDTYAQLGFDVQASWSSLEYYKTSFELIAPKLADLIESIAQAQLLPKSQFVDSATPQLPTPLARKLTREDGFIEPNTLQQVLKAEFDFNHLTKETLELCAPKSSSDHSSFACSAPLLMSILELSNPGDQPILLNRTIHGLSPWPGVWTVLGDKRLKLLKSHLDKDSRKIVLDLVQEEGKTPSQKSTLLGT